MTQYHWKRIILGLSLLFGGAWGWVHWGNWPKPEIENVETTSDFLIVLGGGYDQGRSIIALQAIKKLKPKHVVVTGDGGSIYNDLIRQGVSPTIITHEVSATSTYENALNTKPIVNLYKPHRVVLVTNWFHSHRARRVFESVLDSSIDVCSYTDTPKSSASLCNDSVLRRERYAIVLYSLVYGVKPW